MSSDSMLCQLANALRYSSNLPVRFILAMTSFIWGFSLMLADDNLKYTLYYSVMFEAAPKPHWAVLFISNGVLLTWRMLAWRSRVGWSRIINSMTFAVYFAVLWLSTVGMGYFWPSNSSELVLCVMALWASLRTDFTASDRETA